MKREFESAINNAIDVHISDIYPGGTILHLDGNIRTVGRTDIKRNKFRGITLFGDSYRLGTIPVKKLIIKNIID